MNGVARLGAAVLPGIGGLLLGTGAVLTFHNRSDVADITLLVVGAVVAAIGGVLRRAAMMEDRASGVRQSALTRESVGRSLLSVGSGLLVIVLVQQVATHQSSTTRAVALIAVILATIAIVVSAFLFSEAD